MSNMTVPASIDAAPEASRQLRETVKVQMGRVPKDKIRGDRESGRTTGLGWTAA
jgi:hypothetical protein